MNNIIKIVSNPKGRDLFYDEYIKSLNLKWHQKLRIKIYDYCNRLRTNVLHWIGNTFTDKMY